MADDLRRESNGAGREGRGLSAWRPYSCAAAL
jgi:hypothetical protein